MPETNPLKGLFEKEGTFSPVQKDNPFFNLIARDLVQRFPVGTALDIGCNTGELVHALRSSNIEAYGVDISKNALLHARESVRGYLSQVDIDFEPLPFSEKQFDLVIAQQILQHLQRPGKLISETYRVLKPGGIAFIMTPTPPFEARWWWRTLRIQIDVEHINDHSRAVWIKTFELNGFRYIGHLRGTIQKAARSNFDSPSFWLGRWLKKMGPFGRCFWGWLAGYVRGTFLFQAQEFHPDVLEVCQKRGLSTHF